MNPAGCRPVRSTRRDAHAPSRGWLQSIDLDRITGLEKAAVLPVQGAICQVVAKRGEIRLDFIHGVRLSDPRKLLQGDRLSKRYVPIRSVAEAKRREIADLIREAPDLDL
jgi:hypothetical protein